MKRILSLFVAALSVFNTLAQDVKEPEFIGEAIAYNKATGEVVKLATEMPSTKTRANAALYLTGLGSVKTKWFLEGAHSPAQITNGDDLYIIIRGENNSYSPASYIRVFRFEQQTKKRTSEIAKVGSFSGASDNNQDYASFHATKYGESSYLIKISKLTPGEYGIKIASQTDMISTLSVRNGAQTVSDSGSSIVAGLNPTADAEKLVEQGVWFTDGMICYDLASERYIPREQFVGKYGSEYFKQLAEEYDRVKKAARERKKMERKNAKAKK